MVEISGELCDIIPVVWLPPHLSVCLPFSSTFLAITFDYLANICLTENKNDKIEISIQDQILHAYYQLLLGYNPLFIMS